MKKIDTHTWKEFSMKELGFTNFHGSRLRYVDRKEGDVPFITAGKENQGIIGTIGNEVTTYCDPITIDMFGNVFYHDGLLAGDDNVYFFVNPQIGKYEKMYIVSVIRAQLGTSFAYVDRFRQDDADSLIVALPSKDNQPDFAYMEQYIRSLEQRVQTTLTTFEHLIQLPKHVVNTTNWKAYKIGELFMAQNTGNILTRDVSDGSGTTPFVTASAINNGVAAYIDAGKYTILKGHCILVGGKTFTLTYQKDDFVSNDSHNFTLRLKGDNPYSNKIYLFLLTLLRTTLGQRYSWGDAVTKEKILENEIMLPATPDGTPDFAYMEQYMQRIEQRVQQNLDKIA